MPNLPWPEMDSRETQGRTIRRLLDYLIWVSAEMRQLGHHSGSDREEWCRRVHQAYAALFVPMYPGRGDPYPPDVPPARNPGIWPDVPSSRIAGMTVRHQLTVTEMVAHDLRGLSWEHARPEEVSEWDRRLSLACSALDHGPSVPMPEEALSEPCHEAIKQAIAERKGLKDRARRRTQEIKKKLEERRAAKQAAKKAKKKAAPKSTASVEVSPEKVAPKKAAAKKKAVPKKAVAKKAAAKKKAAPKQAAAKKKAAPQKKAAAKKKAAPKKAAAKKKAT